MSRGMMNMTLRATLIAALFGSPAMAADLLEVLQAAKNYDPEYLAAKSEQSAGEARREIGGTLLKPSVSLVASAGLARQNSAMTGAQFSQPMLGTFNGANFNTSINSGKQTRIALQASQPLYDRELSAQRDQLQLAADVTDMGAVAADQALIARVATSYFDAVRSQAVIELLDEQQDAVGRTYAEISKRRNLGDASKIDLQLTGAQVEATQSKVLNAKMGHHNDELRLLELTGQPVKVAPLNDRFDAEGVLSGSASDWVAKAKANNRQLKMLALQTQVKHAEIDKFDSAFSPKVNLIAQVQRERTSGSGDFGDASNTATGAMVGVQLFVPLTDGYRSAKKDESVYMVQKSQQDYDRAALEIEKQVNATWFALATGKERIESLTRMVALSRDRLNATERSHRQGSRTTLELLGAQSDYVSARMVLLEERISFILNRIRLAALAGEVNEQDLSFANRFLARN